MDLHRLEVKARELVKACPITTWPYMEMEKDENKQYIVRTWWKTTDDNVFSSADLAVKHQMNLLMDEESEEEADYEALKWLALFGVAMNLPKEEIVRIAEEYKEKKDEKPKQEICPCIHADNGWGDFNSPVYYELMGQ